MIKRLCLIALLSLPMLAHAKVQILDRIVAVVNNGVIMESELEQRVDQIRHRLEQKDTQLPPDDVLRKQVLDHMIDDRLQLQLADKAGIKVGDQDLNDALSQIAEHNNMTLDQFAEHMKKEGQNWADFREQVRDQIIISQLEQRQVNQRIHITDREVQHFLNSEMGKNLFQTEFHLEHIFIQVPSDATPQQVEKAKQKAEMVYRKLTNGASFRNMAITYSDGPNALQGGDLDWRPAAQLPTLFAKTASDMKPGDISKPLRSGNGFHILKLVDRRGGANKVITQHKVSHVLISPNALRTPEEAEKLAHKLHDEVVSGKKTFAEVAKNYSDDPGSARDGGELGWVNPGEMVPSFEKMMDKTPKGQVSPVFKTQYGWHFLKVEGVRKTDMSDKYRKMKARQALHKRRFEEELQRWVREKRGEAYVDIRLNGDDSDQSSS